jgi:hypothetical protein
MRWVRSKTLLVFDSNIRLVDPSEKHFMTFVRSKVTFSEAYDLVMASTGLVHVTDNSEMRLTLKNDWAKVWKVVRITDESKFFAEGGQPNDRFQIEALACDNSSVCLTRDVNVTMDIAGEFDYPQQTYDFLMHFFKSNPHRLIFYEFPEFNPRYTRREPCPPGCNFTFFPHRNFSACVNPIFVY